MAAFYSSAIAELEPHLGHPERKQAVAARVLSAALKENLRRFEEGQYLVDMNHIFSPPQIFRDVFGEHTDPAYL